MNNRTKWTFEMVYKEALKYNTKIDFQNSNENAYKAALRQDIDKFCSHMTPLLTNWTEESIQIEANKYNSKNDFRNNSHKAFDAAKKIGLDKFCTHMTGGRFILTKEYIAIEALKFNTRTDFIYGNNSAYRAAIRQGILEKVCIHMKTGAGGFDVTKPGIMYYIKIVSNKDTFYKIGITNRNINIRIKGMKINENYKPIILQELYFKNGIDASILETKLKQNFKKFRYKGEPIMKSGNSELFIIDILKLDSLASNKICRDLES